MMIFKAQIEHPRTHGNSQNAQKYDKLIQSLCKVRDEENAQLDTYPGADTELNGIAEEILAELHKRILQFQANKFFVAVFGSLKAGKSTLINALVGRHVSPTGYGQETTLHCSIILKADKEHPEGIYLHRDTNLCDEQSEEERKKKAVSLLDYFREMESSDTLAAHGIKRSQRFDFDGHDLSGKKDNLTAILTEKDLPRYPNLLLVEIRLDNAHLDQVAFFDMPGLEGCLANVQNNMVLKELCNVADYFIYVQSTVGALSQDAEKYISSIVKKQRKPMVVVFNKIMARYWLTEQAQQELQADYESSAIDILASRAGIKKPQSFTVNAAQAWNAMDGNFDLMTLKPELRPAGMNDDDLRLKLLMESGIADMMTAMKDVCCTQIVPIQDKNAMVKYDEWREEILRPDGKLKQFIAKLEGKVTQQDGKLQCWQEIMKKTGKLVFSHASGGTIYQALDQKSFMVRTISDLRAATIQVLDKFKQRLLKQELSSVNYPSGTNAQDKFDQYSHWDSECNKLVSDFWADFQTEFMLAAKQMMGETQKAFEHIIHDLKEEFDITRGEVYMQIYEKWLQSLQDPSRFLADLMVPQEYHGDKLQPARPHWFSKRPQSNSEADDQRQKQEYRDDLKRRLSTLHDAALESLGTAFEECCREMTQSITQDLYGVCQKYTSESIRTKKMLDSASKFEERLSNNLPKGDI